MTNPLTNPIKKKQKLNTFEIIQRGTEPELKMEILVNDENNDMKQVEDIFETGLQKYFEFGKMSGQEKEKETETSAVGAVGNEETIEKKESVIHMEGVPTNFVTATDSEQKHVLLYESKMLFRAVVHECDKMLRIRNNNVPNATRQELELFQSKATAELTHVFYRIYADALYHLSMIENESMIDFLDEAIYRIKIALEMNQDSVEVYFSYARIIAQKVLCTRDIELVSELKEISEKVFFGVDNSKPLILQSALELAHLLEKVFEVYEYGGHGPEPVFNKEIWEKRVDFMGFVEDKWMLILKSYPECLEAYIGVATTRMTTSDEMIDYLESLEDTLKTAPFDTATILSYLEIALENLEKAQSLCECKPIPLDSYNNVGLQLKLLLGECLVNMGNLTDSTQENDASPEAAIALYKKALGVFGSIDQAALPEEFQSFVESWKTEI